MRDSRKISKRYPILQSTLTVQFPLSPMKDEKTVRLSTAARRMSMMKMWHLGEVS